ncbi:MAG: hypothetical protein ACRC8P_03435 [Spiroplasma sp.]
MIKFEFEIKSKEWWQKLEAKKQDLNFSKTKFINDKLAVNVRILSLLNDKIETANQLPNFGLIVLDQTILNSYDNTSISEQGILSCDFFKARVVDVDSTTVEGVYFHLVKVISGIISINSDHELILTADEDFRRDLFNNKLAAKLFHLFLHHLAKEQEALIKKIKVSIDEKKIRMILSKNLKISRKLLFKTRDFVNECLENKKINYQEYPFLKDELTKIEKENVANLELIEIKNFIETKNNLIVDFLVGREKNDEFFISQKKGFLTAIRNINKEIKLINSEQLSEIYPDSIVDSYEKLEKLKQDYLQLKQNFIDFQNQNPDLIKNFIDESIETQYSEKVGNYEFIHVNFNNLLIDRDVLEEKALEKINGFDDRILFLSNNTFDNSMIVLRISKNLISQINITPLVNQFTSPAFKKIRYNDQDGVFIEASNYQVVNDFISNIINFFKISNNQTI